VKVVSQVKIFSLEDAIITALENNRQVKIGRMNIEKAEAAVNEAFGYALPSVDVSANFSHLAEKPMTPFPDFEALLTNATYGILFNENIIPEDNSKYLPIRTKLQSFALANSFETKAQVTQILFNSAVFRGIGASEIYLQLAKVQMEATISNTILEVKKAFYGVLVTKELLQILQTSLINAEENLANIKALHAQGFTSDYDAMQVEVRVENLKPNVLELENILSNAKNGLKILLNINQNTNIDVTGEFHYSPLNISEDSDYLNNAVQKNLDIQSLSIKKQVDKEFIAIERSEYWPTIAAFGSYAYSGSSDEFDFKTYRTAVVGLSLSMNLFKGGRVTNRVEQAQIATMQTEEQITQLKDYVSSQVINKLMSLKKVQKQVEALTRNVALAQKAYDISVVRYKEGTGTQLEIKNADTELQNAKTMYTKSLHDHIIAGAELDQLLGFIDAKYANVVKDHINE
jgi:outer membrane protein TolC